MLIAAAFCMYNRYVDGLATWAPTDPSAYDEMGRRIVEHGYLAPVRPGPVPGSSTAVADERTTSSPGQDDGASPLADGPGDPVEQELHRDRSERLGGLRQDGQERVEPGGQLDVVEADEPQIGGDLEAALTGGLGDSAGGDVVQGEDRRGRLAEIQEPQCGVARCVRVDGARLRDELGPQPIPAASSASR